MSFSYDSFGTHQYAVLYRSKRTGNQLIHVAIVEANSEEEAINVLDDQWRTPIAVVEMSGYPSPTNEDIINFSRFPRGLRSVQANQKYTVGEILTTVK